MPITGLFSVVLKSSPASSFFRLFSRTHLVQTEDIVTMDNGCVCCTVRGDLVKALLSFLDRRHTFDCILLETTGIADPSPIVATFNQVVYRVLFVYLSLIILVCDKEK